MHLRPGGPGAFGEASRAANLLGQTPLHRVAGDALGARLVVHLLQVGTIAEAPGLG